MITFEIAETFQNGNDSKRLPRALVQKVHPDGYLASFGLVFIQNGAMATPADEASFFYASDQVQEQSTWRHELTHQLFRESRRSAEAPFEDRFRRSLGRRLDAAVGEKIRHSLEITRVDPQGVAV